jgi:Ca2+-binding EF-hand superfamily protein
MVEAGQSRKFMAARACSSFAVHALGASVRSLDLEALPIPAPLFLFALLSSAAPASAPINIVGHAWAPFISPMGEPFRARDATDDTLADWFRQADRNHDGMVTASEMQADAERFFAKLDSDHDGEIDPDELAHYEYEIAPDIQVMSRTKRVAGQPQPAARKDDRVDDDQPGDEPFHGRRRGRGDEVNASLGIGGALQGAARYSLLNIPEPVAAADTDFNRGVSLAEFRQAAIARFQLLDSRRQGSLALSQLEAMPHAPDPDRRRARRDGKAPDARIGNPLPTGP